MAWIESHQSLLKHPKTKKLARLLNVEKMTAIGYLHSLWWWALDYAQDGNLSRYEAVEIADGMEWEGDPQLLFTALVDSGFVDKKTLVIHDWHGGHPSRKVRNLMRSKWESMSRRIRPIILEQDDFTCQICGDTDGPLEIDHIVPLALGGTNDIENLQVLCRSCNRRKGAK